MLEKSLTLLFVAEFEENPIVAEMLDFDWAQLFFWTKIPESIWDFNNYFSGTEYGTHRY